jgi:hypothetical protein
LSRTSIDFNFTLVKQMANFENYFDVVIHSAGRAHSFS